MAKRLRKEEQIMPDIRILTEGDSSVLVEFGKEISPEINRKITATVQLMKEQHIEGVVDMIPAFCSLLVNYDPRVISYDDLKKRLEILLKMEVTAGEGCRKVYEIPVCYGGEYGPDIENIAEHAGLSVEEVIKIHSSRDYLIYMLGFLPGFCYLGGLDERIHTPRLANPRIKINAGSVGIGGSQTGIYPLDSPGGWQLKSGRGQRKRWNGILQPLCKWRSGRFLLQAYSGNRSCRRRVQKVSDCPAAWWRS